MHFRLFEHERTSSQLMGDVAIGSLYGARNGAVGGLFLVASTVGMSLGFVGAMSAACAVGAAIIVIPAMAIHSSFMRYSELSGFLLLAGSILLKTAFAVAAACIGAAILGLPILYFASPVALTAMSFAISNYTNGLITELSAPQMRHQRDIMNIITHVGSDRYMATMTMQ